MPKVVILIQGPEYSDAAHIVKLKEGFSAAVQFPENMRVGGIDDGYHNMLHLFSDKAKYEFFSVGDGKIDITFESIVSLLQKAKIAVDASSEIPLILIAGHGTAMKTSVPTITPHAIARVLEKDADPSAGTEATSEKGLLTSTFFKAIHDNIKVPVELTLFSCESGPAKDSVHLLPPGSKVVTFTNGISPISSGTMIDSAQFLIDNPVTNISVLELIQGYILSSAYDKAKNISISVSGKKPYSFSEFCDSRPKQAISIDELKLIYKDLEKFGLNCKVTKLLKDPSISEEVVWAHINARHDQLEKFKAVCYRSLEEKFDFDQLAKWGNPIVKELKASGYGALEDAIWNLANSSAKESSWLDKYYNEYANRMGAESHFLSNSLAFVVQFILYSKRPTVQVEANDLKLLKDEIEYVSARYPEDRLHWDLSSLFHDIAENTGIDLAHQEESVAGAISDTSCLSAFSRC